MRKKGSFFCLSCLLPELWSLKCRNWLIFVFSADSSKKSVTSWAKYLSAHERPYLALLENAKNYWVLRYR